MIEYLILCELSLLFLWFLSENFKKTRGEISYIIKYFNAIRKQITRYISKNWFGKVCISV